MTLMAEATDASLLRAAEIAVDAWSESLDPALLTGSAAADDMARAEAMKRKITAVTVGLARRVEETRAFKATHRDAAGWLASTAGSSVGEANRMLRTGERLENCPATKEAFEAGTLSLAEADLVSEAVKADPSAETDLVEFAARRHNLNSLRERTERVRRGAHRAEDEAKRAAEIRASRRWVESNHRVDGAPCVEAKFVPQDYAAAKQVLARFQQLIFDAARREGRREPEVAYTCDAVLAAILAGGTAVGIESPPLSTAPNLPAFKPGSMWSPASSDAGPGLSPSDSDHAPSTGGEPVVLPGGSSRDARRPCVIVDAIALQRGYAASGETCEIPGVGPVEVAWARRLIGDGIFDVVVHNGVDITTFATSTRHVPRALEVALAVRDPQCTDPGCTQGDHLEIDHITDYATSHDTSYRNLRNACGPGHEDKTQGRLSFERHDDQWWATPSGQASDPGGTGRPPQRRTAPVGEHLSRWNLDHLPDEIVDERVARPR
jgi:hypothetical protein